MVIRHVDPDTGYGEQELHAFCVFLESSLVERRPPIMPILRVDIDTGSGNQELDAFSVSIRCCYMEWRLVIRIHLIDLNAGCCE